MGRSLEPDSRGRGERDRPDGRETRQGRERLNDEINRLRETIDRASEDKPTMSELMLRLESAGVRMIPSLQKSGRLNGMSYEVNGTRINGSELGRSYTAQGLINRKGITYDPERDKPSCEEAARRARENPAAARPQETPERSSRTRERDGLEPDLRAALKEIGRFRTVFADDFLRIHYHEDRSAWRRDLNLLARQGLLERRSVVITTHVPKERSLTRSVSVLTLTKTGRDLLKRSDLQIRATGQALYAGFVKPREIAHDAAIYRMYQAEAAHIAKEGGHVKRLVLDFELKKKAYSPLAKARKVSEEEYRRKQAEVAQENGLKVIEGKIRFPDLRIEYETATGDSTRVDLELATEHYRGEHMSAKSQAGFKIYAEQASFPPGGSFGRSAVWDDHEITIFSF